MYTMSINNFISLNTLVYIFTYRSKPWHFLSHVCQVTLFMMNHNSLRQSPNVTILILKHIISK